MRRLPLLLGAVGLLLALGALSGIVNQGFQELGRARAERAALERERADLSARIARLEATLAALDRDPAATESLARRELGMIRPGETVILLATPTPAALTLPETVPILDYPD